MSPKILSDLEATWQRCLRDFGMLRLCSVAIMLVLRCHNVARTSIYNFATTTWQRHYNKLPDVVATLSQRFCVSWKDKNCINGNKSAHYL